MKKNRVFSEKKGLFEKKNDFFSKKRDFKKNSNPLTRPHNSAAIFAQDLQKMVDMKTTPRMAEVLPSNKSLKSEIASSL